jgi:Domain of unknown function (DUF1830)
MLTTKLKVVYINPTQYYQVLRINDSRCFIERAVSPHQQVVFEACADAIAEIYSSEFVTSILSEKMLISDLIKMAQL